MFNRLRQKWKVGWWQFLLIFTTFALGGSLCGFTSRRLLALTSITNPWLWVPLYIVIMTLLWPICVLSVSLLLGQFPFFKKFLSRLASRIVGRPITEK